MIAYELKYALPPGLRRRLGIARRRFRVRNARNELNELIASPALTPHQKELLSGVSSRVSFRDEMYRGDGQYFKIGLSAMDCIEQAMQAARMQEAEHVLDLPCGYGRVLRFLARRFDSAQIHACELVPDASRYCAENFGAVPLQSTYDIGTLTLETRFDLIWCGSLVTHLTARRIADLLGFFSRHLNTGGLAVITTHGDYVAERLLTHAPYYGLPHAAITTLINDYRQNNFAYVDYPNSPGYGVSLSTPEWVREQALNVGNLREVYFGARGWNNHQDVFGFVNDDGIWR